MAPPGVKTIVHWIGWVEVIRGGQAVVTVHDYLSNSHREDVLLLSSLDPADRDKIGTGVYFEYQVTEVNNQVTTTFTTERDSWCLPELWSIRH